MTHQVVLITGAAGNLGRAVAGIFRSRGARLVVADLHADALVEAYEGDEGVLVAPVDLLDRLSTQKVVQKALAHFGAIDVCCHIAGGFRMGDAVHETTPETWDFLMDINAKSMLNVASAVVPHMSERRSGKFVTIGAAAAARGAAQMGAYGAAKSALIRLTEAMSVELRDQGINVNCVLPSIIDTPENRSAMPDADVSRWVTPDALAEVLAFLCSDAARAINGAAIPVTGRA